jgi:hypothetical protein
MENQILSEKIGSTYSQKLIDECEAIYKENFLKKFPEYFEKNHTKMSCLIATTENLEIKSIGMSCLDDLLTDNWGAFFGGLFSGNNPTGGLAQMKNSAGVQANLRVWGNQIRLFNLTNVAVGMLIKTGTDSTTPTRQDVNLGSLVDTLSSGNGGYNSGLAKVEMPASKVSTTNYSIEESGLFGIWQKDQGGGETYLLSRDIISPSVSVLVGQTINANYELILS